MPMRQGDLAYITDVKNWLNSASPTAYPTGNDTLLATLITSCSAFIQNYISRPIAPATYNETYNGSGGQEQFLRNRPIIKVNALSIAGVGILPSSPPSTGYGWMNDATSVYFIGGAFPRNIQNVVVNYDAGFQSVYNGVVPVVAGNKLNIAALGNIWNTDRGLLINGVAAALVASPPAAGQYSLDAASDGTMDYEFAAADANKTLAITYGYTPFDLAHVVVETVGEAFKRRNRIGEASANIGNGQVISFSLKDLNATTVTLLRQYVNVVPVQ